MSDWLALIFSYSIVDFIPVEADIYARLFERANKMFWPLPLVGVFCCIFVVFTTASKNLSKYCYVCLWFILSLSCISLGGIFFLTLFNELNWLGFYIGIAFIMQSILLLLKCFLKPEVATESGLHNQLIVVSLILVLVAYALMPVFTDRPWQSTEVFGVAPDPTCLVMLAVIVASKRIAWWLIAIPLVWCVISLALSYAMQRYEGFILLVGLIVLFVSHIWGSQSHHLRKLRK